MKSASRTSPKRTIAANTLACSTILWLAVVGNAQPLQHETTAQNPKTPARASKTVSAPKLDERDWVGTYPGGFTGGSLELRPDHSFTFQRGSCLGVFDKNTGAWVIEGDVLILRPASLNVRDLLKGIDVRFIPVKWDDRYYLVDENNMPGFCAIARPSEERSQGEALGLAYIKQDKQEWQMVKGKPLIPARYQHFYEKGPVEAKVIGIDAKGNVILDKGTADRLKPGWLLVSKTGSRIFQNELKIIKVEWHRATAKAFYYRESVRLVGIGDVFTTGDYLPHSRGTKDILMVFKLRPLGGPCCPWGTGYTRFPQLPPTPDYKSNIRSFLDTDQSLKLSLDAPAADASSNLISRQ